MIGISQNIFIQYLFWQFFEVPRNILKGWRNFLLFYLNYFSIPLLFKTLFSHWRKYKWTYPKGLNIGKRFEVLFSNLLSRFLGAIMRIILIFIGLLLEIFLFLIGIIIFLGWLFLPVFLILGIYHGFRILL